MGKGRILLIIVFTAMLCACNHRGNDVLHQVETIIEEHPDSAFAILNRDERSIAGYSQYNRMRYLLLRTEAMNKIYIPLDTVKYIDKVLDYFTKHGTAKERIKAHYMAGNVYRDKGNSPLALQYYNEAVSLVDTTRGYNEFRLLSRIYGQMADIFDRQRFPQKELEVLDKAALSALKAKDTLVYIENVVRIGNAYNMLGNQKEFVIQMNKGYEDYKRIGREDYASTVLGTMIDYYLQKGRLSQAKYAIDEYRSKSEMFDKSGEIFPGSEIFYFYVGNYYEKINRNDSALWYYYKLLHFDKNISHLENGYKGLMSVYLRMHKPDSVAKYAKLYAEANDSANILHSADAVSRTQALYDYSESQQIAGEKMVEAAHMRLTILIIVLILVLLSIVSYIVFRSYKVKNIKQIIRANRLYSETLIKYDKSVRELNEIRHDHRRFEKEKLEEIKSLRKQLVLYTGGHPDMEKSKFEHCLLDHDTVVLFHQLAARGKSPSDVEWTCLMDIVNKLMTTFVTSINEKGKGLSDKEIKVCVLTKLNFCPSEIATLFNLKIQSITNLRAYLNKKLFGNSGTKTFDANIHRL